MQSQFEMVGGSVIGKDHYWDKRNCQDAFHILERPNLAVAVVCDGCGDRIQSPFSEVGAQLGARLVAETIARQAGSLLANGAWTGENQFPAWERIRQDILAVLRVFALQMGSSLSEVVNNYFLFTVVGVLITPRVSEFFSIGDGVVVVNGEEIRLGPFPDNTPPYLAYGLVQTSLDPNLLRFGIQRVLPTSSLKTFLLGCDGVVDLIQARDQKIPGKEEAVGPLSQFWEEDRYFANRLAVGRRLTVINKDHQRLNLIDQKIDRQNGLLSDDTTIVVGRRKR